MARNRTFRKASPVPPTLAQLSAHQAVDSAPKGPIRLAAVEWITGLVPWDLYCTLTYDPSRASLFPAAGGIGKAPPSHWACQRHFNRWVDHCAVLAQRPVFAIGALEETTLGWPHFHVVLSMAGCDPEEFRAISASWFERHGFAQIERVDAAAEGSLLDYLAKYFTKDSMDLVVRGELPGPIHPRQRWLTGL